jgi:hypothetical protein
MTYYFALEIDGAVKTIPYPEWVYVSGGHGSSHGHRVYRDEKLKVQCELVTKRRKNGEYKSGECSYYIDGDPREFDSETEMLRALLEEGKAIYQFVGRTDDRRREAHKG